MHWCTEVFREHVMEPISPTLVLRQTLHVSSMLQMFLSPQELNQLYQRVTLYMGWLGQSQENKLMFNFIHLWMLYKHFIWSNFHFYFVIFKEKIGNFTFTSFYAGPFQ